MIQALTGDDFGIHKNENHVLCEWKEKGRVVFSSTRQGDSIFFHFAAENGSQKHIRKAIIEYIDWVFDNCPWCTMMLTAIDKRSVMKLAKSVGGIDIAEYSDGKHLFMRLRNG